MREIEEIKHLMEEVGIDLLSMTSPTIKLSIVMSGAAQGVQAGQDQCVTTLPTAAKAQVLASTPAPEATADIRHVNAPRVGTFVARHATRKQPILEPGMHVAASETLGYIKDGMLMYPVIAPCAGIFIESLHREGQAAGYGTPLFSLHAK